MPSVGELIPVVLITGPTGIGKTALAVWLGSYLPVEIVSADSRQIYRYMDIATAKPNAAERAAVRHHLIDIVEPDQVLSLAGYQRLANAAIQDIHNRGKLPLLVGGTGQYLTAVMEGWSAPEVPPNPELRAELEAQAAAEGGPEALFERLRELDPEAASWIDPRNLRRVIRAIEVCLISGRKFSAQRTKTPPPYQFLKLALTEGREILYTRLDARIDQMIAGGLLDEVRTLHERGYGWGLPSMSGLGYAQLGAFVRGEQPLSEAINAFKRDTHAFVRRQYTWFRRYQGLVWFENADPHLILKTIRAGLSGF
ncbi:tRNA dimethylallyltransferase [Anaerolineae bacterium]|nr:tRNA dimethylallyltransferase [Anaerolineae bacterium]